AVWRVVGRCLRQARDIAIVLECECREPTRAGGFVRHDRGRIGDGAKVWQINDADGSGHYEVLSCSKVSEARIGLMSSVSSHRSSPAPGGMIGGEGSGGIAESGVPRRNGRRTLTMPWLSTSDFSPSFHSSRIVHPMRRGKLASVPVGR